MDGVIQDAHGRILETPTWIRIDNLDPDRDMEDGAPLVPGRATPIFTARFMMKGYDDVPFKRLAACYFYAVIAPDRPAEHGGNDLSVGPYCCVVDTRISICTDLDRPRATTSWTEVIYGDPAAPGEFAEATVAAATQAALDFSEIYDPDQINWDGEDW